MSRFYSYIPNRVPSTNMYTAQSPVTPASKFGSRPTSKLQDSPFSDYFTDDGQSNPNDSPYRAPSDETQQLLVRLNKLQAQLMRSSPEDVLSEHEKTVIVARKISEIETQFHALNSETLSQTRRPAELEDSGLFMEDDDEEEETAADNNEETPDAQMDTFERAAQAYLASGGARAGDEDDKSKHDILLQDAQKVLESVSKANDRLRQFNAELRANHEKSGSVIDALETENAKLRSKATISGSATNALQTTSDNLKLENNSLKTDLSLNRAELLYLKLRHRALEVEVEALHNAGHRLETYAPEMKEEIQQIKRAKVRERMCAWEDAWLGIEHKMRERRAKHDGPLETETSFDYLFDMNHPEEISEEIVEIAEITQVIETKKSVHGEDSAVGIEDTPSPPPADSTQDEYEYVGIVQVNQSTQTDGAFEEYLQARDSKAAYAEQTTSLPLPATSSWVLATAVDNEDGLQLNTNLEDCAITTSSEDNDTDSILDTSADAGGHDGGEVKTPKSPLKAAWRDLWDGLTNLAGMGEGY